MNETVVILVTGEALANGYGSTIAEQRLNAKDLAEGLYPILATGTKLAVLHGNKPQVGFVLFRSEVASHVLHPIPLDVCGADTQGATGYMISQALMNVLEQHDIQRKVLSIVTQTLVEPGNLEQAPLKAIGPWFDRDKAEQYRQTRNWKIVEEPGRGYRRGVPSLPAKEILEIEVIKKLVDMGYIVIAGGGGGIPVMRNDQGKLVGIEAVTETEQVACMVGQQLSANVLLIIVDKDDKFILSGLVTDGLNNLSLDSLDAILEKETIRFGSVQRSLRAASDFLHHGGEQVVITTLHKFPDALSKKSGLRLGFTSPSIDLFKI